LKLGPTEFANQSDVQWRKNKSQDDFENFDLEGKEFWSAKMWRTAVKQAWKIVKNSVLNML
jgi:hypothetical protein